MADDFRPGKSYFWIFFTVSTPLTVVIIFFLVLNQNWEYWQDRGWLVLNISTQRRAPQARQQHVTRSKHGELPL
ncbi:hypothetical protein G647_01779 [Cladophialophora carrionii CBS 160.54]|uniref:Uncharacterized protein n=1 Tax=Cladophialophora carrionii CBS 160.54 TaxID=1279043 RepID=V9DRP5_9EURO|nr:uncharacterized protein G647_01779 [Cladophialophora carrionii CBS 160.54]ETI29326.1 hypothetical protein G647_01779 [Cladophialophora carrionii CBS 160.54]